MMEPNQMADIPPVYEGDGADVTSMGQAFSQLPPGVQRVLIAVLFVVILVAIVYLRRMVRTEEEVREEAELFGSERPVTF